MADTPARKVPGPTKDSPSIVMVSLLDFVFRWLPYFVICFPVPGLKAKGAGSST